MILEESTIFGMQIFILAIYSYNTIQYDVAVF